MNTMFGDNLEMIMSFYLWGLMGCACTPGHARTPASNKCRVYILATSLVSDKQGIGDWCLGTIYASLFL